MAFANELIGEEDKRRIDWSRFKVPYRSDPHRPWKWTIDRERDVFLLMLAGAGREQDHPELYALSWRGSVITFSAERQSIGDFKSGVELSWRLFNVAIPAELESQRTAILNSIKDAIDAHGSIYDREHIRAVHIEFTSGPKYSGRDVDAVGHLERKADERRTISSGALVAVSTFNCFLGWILVYLATHDIVRATMRKFPLIHSTMIAIYWTLAIACFVAAVVGIIQLIRRAARR